MMIIHNARFLLGRLRLIENLVQEIKIKNPQISDQEAFSLAHTVIEKLQDSGVNSHKPLSKAS